MNKKISLSIGIVAYNEEVNIGKLLQRLLVQSQKHKIEEIIVISDGSIDQTINEIKPFDKSIVKLIKHSKSLGKAFRENQLLKIYKGDFLLILDADILPDKNLLKYGIATLQTNKNFGIIGCKVIPLKASNFFEKIINLSVSMKQYMYERVNYGNNIYLCHGRARIFSRGFTEKLKWRKGISEDAYSYLSCIKFGYKFIYEQRVKVYYRSPQNLNDHIMQSARFFQGQIELKKIFDEKLLVKSYKLPKTLLLKSMIIYFFKNPIIFTCYIMVLFIAKYKSATGKKYLANWDQSATSKTLISSKS